MKSIILFQAFLILCINAYSQNVGVGTTNPVFKLDVRNGSINVDSVYRIDSIKVLSVLGTGNLFVGKNAGRINTGTSNTFSGDEAGYSNTTGLDNTFFGNSAGRANISGDYNSFFGRLAGFKNLGVRNSFFGHAAGLNNTTGTRNSFFGQDAGLSNKTASYNSFFGHAAGISDTTGHSNSFFGEQAGPFNASGNSNAFFGQNTGYSNSTGNENSFVGQAAGFYNTAGNYNSFFGRASGTTNTSGTYNTAMGVEANVNTGILNNATALGAKSRVDCSNCLVLGSVNGINGATANVKVGIGITNPVFKLDVKNGSINTDSVYRISNTTVLAAPGTSNLFVGKEAGRITTHAFNTFVGTKAGFSNTSGISNAFFGESAGYENSTGTNNSIFGRNAGYKTLSSYNAFFGDFAGYNNSTGSSNSFFGRGAGYLNFNGRNNSFFGDWAGSFITSGSYNTAVGDSANFNAGIITNATAIGAKARVDCSNCMVLGSVNGVNGATANVNVGIGTNNPNAPLAFAAGLGKKINLYQNTNGNIGMSVQSYYLQIYSDDPLTTVGIGYQQNSLITGGNPTGFQYNLDVYGDGNAVLRGNLTQLSDLRAKKDITPLQHSLQKLKLVNGYNYNWIANNADHTLQTGVLAQEVQKIFPELVKEDGNGMLSVNYSGLIPVMIESIKEQQKQIDEFKNFTQIQQKQLDDQQQELENLNKLVQTLLIK